MASGDWEHTVLGASLGVASTHFTDISKYVLKQTFRLKCFGFGFKSWGCINTLYRHFKIRLKQTFRLKYAKK